mgnify:CR=1 FL=1
MGGVAGHMSHLYDNPDLKFSQMMDIFKAAANGELEGTEKTDGQNLFVGYNVAEKRAKAARNKSNVQQGGLDAAGLAQKFAGRGSVEKAFNEAFKAFELTAQSFPADMQIDLFGDGINHIIFYNAEIQDPRNPNVINYDTALLNVHRVGHFAVDLKTGELLKPEALDLSGNAIKLENTLDHVQDKIANLNFGVQVNAIRRLEGLTDDEPVNFAINRLNHILSSAGVSDNETVGQYMVARLLPMIRREVELPEEKENMLIKKILGVKGINIRVIRKDLNPDQAAAVSRLANENNKKVLLQTAIQPLEDIVHDFSVEMIRNLQSAFVLDQDAEVKRLQDKLRRAKEDIEASGNEEAMKILKRQMKKIKEIENITTAAEGFVFDYDGYTYKFTGNFAPMNQLLGLFEYGRGDIPPMRRSITEAEDDGMAKDIIAVYPGRFQPMGRHHYETYEEIARQYGVENTFVATSDKVSPPKSPLNFEEKKEVMIAHGIPANQIVKVKNPYYARELSDQHNPDEVEIVYFVGEKDMKENPRFSKTSGTTKEGYDWRLEVAPHVSFEIPGFGEMCGTSCRAALGDSDEQLFANIMNFFDEDLHNLFKEKFGSGTIKEEVQSMPLGIFLRLIEEVMNEETKKQKKISKKIKFLKDEEGLTQKQAVGKALGMLGEEEEQGDDYADKLAKSDSGTEGTSFKDAIKEEDEEELEEASGVGAVTGYSGPGKRDSEPETLIREGMEQMNRHEIYEEIRLRKIIREGIKKINAKIEDEKQQEVLEEQRLRNAIRKLLLVEKTVTGDTEPAAHESTGINFLEKLLKNIIPTLETDYKTLTSDKEQRESFRNHILRAIQDTIAPLKITTQAEPGPGSDEQIALAEEELDNQELTVKIEDDPDFIDIRSDKEIEDEEAELSDEPSSAVDEKEQFGIEGENEVGRNAAFDTFKKISKQIVSKYDELTGSADDQKLFYEYLLTNIKLYFDKFENDMSPVEEPESPDYDPNQMDQEAESAEVEPETVDQEAEMGL